MSTQKDLDDLGMKFMFFLVFENTGLDAAAEYNSDKFKNAESYGKRKQIEIVFEEERAISDSEAEKIQNSMKTEAAGDFSGLLMRKNMAGYQGHGPSMIVGGPIDKDLIRELRSMDGLKAAKQLKPFITHIYKNGIERITQDELKKYNKLIRRK